MTARLLTGALLKSGARNSGRVASGYSTDSKDSGDSSEKKSDAPVIELTQQVCTHSRSFVLTPPPVPIPLSYFLSMPNTPLV